SVRCLFPLFVYGFVDPLDPHSFPTRRSSDLCRILAHPASRSWLKRMCRRAVAPARLLCGGSPGPRPISGPACFVRPDQKKARPRSEEHTSELQSLAYLVCRLLLEKKNGSVAR